MQVFPFVAGFACVCFLMAYGTQKRTWWAWYGGWVFGAMAAAAVCNLAIAFLHTAQAPLDWIIGCVFLTGGGCVWTFWSIFWVKNRGLFLRRKTPKP